MNAEGRRCKRGNCLYSEIPVTAFLQTGRTKQIALRKLKGKHSFTIERQGQFYSGKKQPVEKHVICRYLEGCGVTSENFQGSGLKVIVYGV